MHGTLSAAEMSSTYRDISGKLKEITEQYIRDGFALFSKDYTIDYWKRERETLLLHDVAVRKYLRAIAKERRCPFVVVETITSNTWESIWGKWSKTGKIQHIGSITIPRQKRAEKLFAALLLAKEVGVCRGSIWTTVFKFKFEGQNMSFLENFVHQCRTDPEFRKILKVTSESNHAQDLPH